MAEDDTGIHSMKVVHTTNPGILRSNISAIPEEGGEYTYTEENKEDLL